jgi:hypothetical protein
MRKVRHVLRLKHTLGMSWRQISEATGIVGSVGDRFTSSCST